MNPRRALAAAAAVLVVGGAGSMVSALALTMPNPAVLAAAAGSECVPVKPPPVVDASNGAGMAAADQRSYAQLIASVGASMGVSRDGQIIAVATAIVESGLRNLSGGDRDSAGLFQQRPSQGWGTLQQVTDPEYASRAFYEHLQALPGWQAMDPGDAAQAIQRSGYPGRYALHMEEAARMVGTGVSPVTAAVDDTVECQPAQIVQAAVKGDGAFTDGPATPAGNMPRTPAQAIAFAYAEAASGNSGWYRRCLAFVAAAYGGMSGVSYAIDEFWVTPTNQRRAADSPEGHSPPPGAALYWDTGQRAGHVALAVGSGLIASNDIGSPGRISIVPASAPETQWHATYVGWTDPGVFPKGA